MPPSPLDKAILAALGLTAGTLSGCDGVFGPCLDFAVETDTQDPGTDPDTDSDYDSDSDSDSDTAATAGRWVLDRGVLPDDVRDILRKRD